MPKYTLLSHSVSKYICVVYKVWVPKPKQKGVLEMFINFSINVSSFFVGNT